MPVDLEWLAGLLGISATDAEWVAGIPVFQVETLSPEVDTDVLYDQTMSRFPKTMDKLAK